MSHVVPERVEQGYWFGMKSIVELGRQAVGACSLVLLRVLMSIPQDFSLTQALY